MQNNQGQTPPDVTDMLSQGAQLFAQGRRAGLTDDQVISSVTNQARAKQTADLQAMIRNS